MDVFQLIGDFLHLVAILLLLLKILASKNVVGLSYKTQEIFIVVFLTRYSDMVLENHWGSIYFNIMRFIFIGINAMTIYYMRFKRPYKLVPILWSRATMQRPTASHTTICIWWPPPWPSSFITSGQSTASSNHSRGGSKQLLFCPSSTWLLNSMTWKISLLTLYSFWVSIGSSTSFIGISSII